jgi:hypothetical protein
MPSYRFGGRRIRSSIALAALEKASGSFSGGAIHVSVAASSASRPAAHERAWTHHWRAVSGATTLSLARQRDGWCLQAPGVAEFAVDTSLERIVITPLSAVAVETLEHLLVDQVLPRVIAHQGACVLHAAAVEACGGAALLVGESGRGKSTWSAVLQGQGHQVLSDDCVVLDTSGSSVRALGTYPSLRLQIDTLRRLYSTATATSPLGADGKVRVPVSRGNLRPDPLAVHAIYVLDEASRDDDDLVVEPLSPPQAHITLISNTFRLDPSVRQATIDLFAKTASIAAQVPVFSLRCRRDLALLPALSLRIVDHLRRQLSPTVSASSIDVAGGFWTTA